MCRGKSHRDGGTLTKTPAGWRLRRNSPKAQNTRSVMAKDQSNHATRQQYFEGKCEWDAPIGSDHFIFLYDLLCRHGLDESIVAKALDRDDSLAVQKLLAWLRDELNKLREEEKKPGRAPARRQTALPRIHIADLAVFLLDKVLSVTPASGAVAKSNRENLICLVEELLDVDRHRGAFANQAQYTPEFQQATTNDAAAALKGETIAVNKLARKIGVSPATIIAWRNSDNYKLRVKALRSWAAMDKKWAQRIQRAANEEHHAEPRHSLPPTSDADH
jgi:hypothetical protein